LRVDNGYSPSLLLRKMHKILISFVVILNFLNCRQACGTEQDSKIGIKIVEEPGEIRSNRAYSTCKGTLPESAKLDRVGLTKDDLSSGVDCIFADFDGNGIKDFLLFGPLYKSKDDLALAIFNGTKGILRTQVLAEAGHLEPFAKDDRERKNYPKFKSVYGFIHLAQGDIGIVYFYDKNSGLFKKEKYIYPPHYEEAP